MNSAGSPSTSLRRLWNRLRGAVRGHSTGFLYSNSYQVDLGVTPIDGIRGERIFGFLLAQGMTSLARLTRPEPASLRDLHLAHSKEYLESLREPTALREIVGFDLWPDLYEQVLLSQRAAVGGTMLATRRAIFQKGAQINLGGGFHHADRDSGRGFCIFNDIAVAILSAREYGFDKPILVVDLDIHDGNGTRDIFRDDGSVFTFSIHNQDWSRQTTTASLSIELAGEVEDEAYLHALRENLPRILQEVRPGLVYYVAGTDPASDDKIGNWNITKDGMLARDRYVVSTIHKLYGHALPLVILLGGGYGPNTWKYSARFFSWLLTGSSAIEPPSTADTTLARYRRLARGITTADLEGETGDDDWGLTDSDITGGLGASARDSKFLGYYTRHALELALDKTGILDRLRSLGFYSPHLVIDLDNPGGHTLQLFADSQMDEILFEIRLRIDSQLIPDMKLLSIEWLLMENPRADFSPTRPRLPQQTHPGLGLVSDVMALLVTVCDRLELDGIVFTPSHYHLAVKARKYLRFLNSKDDEVFERMQRELEGLSLVEASHRIARGQSAKSAPPSASSWHPMPMVLPVSDSMRDLVGSSRHQGPD